MTSVTEIPTLAPTPELEGLRAVWDNPFQPGDGLALAAAILDAPLRTHLGNGRWVATLVINSHGWDRADGDRADAAGEPGSDAWRQALGRPRRATLTADGRGAITEAWCTNECPAGDAEVVYYERWTAEGRVAHGLVCRECRRLVQTG